MVTYLSALRFAVNVEHILQQLQHQRFTLTGDTGARAFPPLIPLHLHDTAPDPAWLDGIRRRHVVKLSAATPAAATPAAATLDLAKSPPAETPPARVSLTEQGIIALQRALSEWTEGSLAVAEFTPHYPPEIVLSWQPEEAQPAPVALPETSALWLSVFRMEYGHDPWWEYLRWTQVYSRRLKAQRH